jgi:hypothetical protein
VSTQESSSAQPSEPAAADPEALKADIERTRVQLGQTVAALVAKTDVKARAQEKVAKLRTRAATQVKDAQAELAGRATAAAGAVRGAGQSAQRQAASRVGGAVTALRSGQRPDPRAMAGTAVAAVRKNRKPVAAAAAVVLGVLAGWLAMRRMRR